MGNTSFDGAKRRMRLFLLALVAAFLIPVATASAADKVANPGQFEAEIIGGDLKLKDFEIPISEITPAPTVKGSVNANGNVVIPSSGVNFPALEFDLDGNNIDVFVMPTGTDWTGTIDPDSGEFVLSARLRVKAEGTPMGISLGSSCYVGESGTGNNLFLNPITTNAVPANGAQPAMSGVPYDSDSGEVTVVNNTVSVPGASGCGPLGLANGPVNDALGLPSASGNNSMSLVLKFTKNAPAAPAVARYTANPQQGRIPFDVDFDASASTSTLGEIDEYRWDFDGDGVIDDVTAEPTVTHTYDTTGVFKTKLTISTQGYETTRSRATVTARAVIATYTETPPHFTQERDATFRFEANEEGATFECKLLKNGEAVSLAPDDGEGDEGEEGEEPGPIDYVPCTSPVEFIDLEDADYTMNVRAVGADDGAKGLPAVWEFRVDNIPPVATIVAKPPQYFNKTSFPLVFTSNEPGSTFECRVLQEVPAEEPGDGEDEGEPTEAAEPEFEPCESGEVVEWAEVEGPVTFEVRPTDRAGNLGDPVSASWELDFTPPTSNISYGPPNPTNQVGGAYAEKCNGNFFECLILPKTEVTTVGNTAQRFDFAAVGTEPGASYICQFNDADERGCQSGVQTGTGVSNPTETWNLNELMRRVGNPVQGENTFRVWAVDRSGNRQTEPSVYKFVYDTIAPKVTAMAKPAEFTKSVNNTVIFQSDEAAVRFECKTINNTGGTVTGFPTGTGSATGFAPCNPGQLNPTMGWQTAEGQTDGRKGLQVRAVDLAGNTQTTNNAVLNDGALNVWWTVDNTAPVASFAAGTVQQGSYTTSTNATINLAATDTPINFGTAANGIAAQQPKYECSFNNAAFSVCTTPVNLTDLTPGAKSFRVRVTDQATNVSAIIERNWTVVNASNASVALTAKPTDVIGIRDATYEFTPDNGTAECRIDATAAQNEQGTGWVACDSPHTFTGLADGRHQAEIRANSTAVPVVHNFAVYANVPTVNINSQPGIARPDGKRYTGLSEASHEITFSSAANPEYAPGETTFECRYYVEGEMPGPFEDCESPFSAAWDKNDEGSELNFEVRPTSSTGNLGAAKTAEWTVDTVKPTVALGNPAPAVACGNGAANGPGPAGCVATASSTQPGLVSSVAAARFQATSSDPVNGTLAFACQLNDGPKQNPCTNRTSGFPTGGNPQTLVLGSARGNNDNFGSAAQGGAIATNAVNTMKIWSISKGGNESDPVVYTWRHDNIAPTFGLKNDPPARTNLGTVTDPLVVKIEADEDMYEEKGFACRLINNGTTSTNGTNPGANPNSPGSGWVTCPMDLIDPEDPDEGFDLKHATWTADNLNEGNYALDIRGWDTIWNVATGTSSSTRPNVADWNANGRRYIFTIDRTAPTVNITGGPAEGSTVPRDFGEFTFTISEPAGQIKTTECRLDPADPDDIDGPDADEWVDCTSPFAFQDLENGEHVFQVRSLDTAGNQGNPVTRNWTVDTTMPEIDLSSDLNGPVTNQTTVEFDFTVTPADSTLECRLLAPEGYPAPEPDPDPDPDPVDPGEGDPGTGDGDGGDDTGNRAAPEDEGDDEGEAPAEPEFEACDSPVEFTDMIDGEYTFEVKATNTLGTEGEIASRSWTVDTVDPVATIQSGPAALTNAKTAELKFGSDKAGSTFECQLDGGAAQPCDSPKMYSGLADGNHTFTVVATDPAGNASEAVSRSWTVDTVAPVTTIDQGPSGTVDSKQAKFEFSSSKAGSTFECQFDGSGWAGCTSPKEFTGLGNGLHTLRVRATDPLGNVGQATERNWAVNVPECPPGQVGEYPDCKQPEPEVCPEGTTGTPPDCVPVKPEPVEECEAGQLGKWPNCVTPLKPQPKPTKQISSYDPATGRLAIRLKCPNGFKPKCQGTAVAVTGKGKKAKVMSSKVKQTAKAGKWKLVTLTIKPKFRETVEKMTAVNKKQLVVRQTVKSKKKKKKNVFHTYKVRIKG